MVESRTPKVYKKPPGIILDVQEMMSRQRVSSFLKNEQFCQEMEQLVLEQKNFKKGQSCDSIDHCNITNLNTTRNGTLDNTGCEKICKIYDIRPNQNHVFSTRERISRSHLAAIYRLLHLYGWNSDLDAHATIRVDSEKEKFLIRPSNQFSNNVSAKSLFMINRQSNILWSPACSELADGDFSLRNLAFNPSTFKIHSLIYSCRPDVKCIIDVKIEETLLVSAAKKGLKNLCRHACVGQVAYINALNIDLLNMDQDEAMNKVNDAIGSNTKCCFLVNDGLLVFSPSVEESFYLTKKLVVACKVQIKAEMNYKQNFSQIDETTADEVCKNDKEMVNVQGLVNESDSLIDGSKMNIWDFEFEALMRRLDDMGYRTAYPYILNQTASHQYCLPNVSLPPACISANATNVSSNLMIDRSAYIKRYWMTSPHAYKKNEKEKHISGHTNHWQVSNGTSTLIKLQNDNSNFALQGENPDEFVEMHNAIKDSYYKESVNSGPESKLINNSVVPRNDGLYTAIGSVSRGVIQSQYRDTPDVYASCFHNNPFTSKKVHDVDLEAYQIDKNGAVNEKEPDDVVLSINDTIISSLPVSNDKEPNTSNSYEEIKINVPRPREKARTISRPSLDSKLKKTPSVENVVDKVDNETEDKNKKKRFKKPSFMKKKKMTNI